MLKRWVLKENADKEVVRNLAHELNIDNTLAGLLVQRGINNFDEAKAFFRPQIDQLHDPFLMKDMDKAIERIDKAILNSEKIMIYGDYDVDGTTAVSLVFTFLKSFHSNIEFYIPDRYNEGYGVSWNGIEFAEKNNFNLIIALDCGIKAVDKVQAAKEKGIDFIICDHHRPGDEIPDAVAVLDPKRDDCDYPFDGLSGCGIGFKLIQAYSLKNNIPFSDLIKYLDLVAASIAADIVPVTGENRILAYHGLNLINTNPRPGFESILEYSNVKRINGAKEGDCIFSKELTISDLVFLVGPRINAAGRIKDAKNSVDLLICDNIKFARDLAKQINIFNTERRDLDAQMTQDALLMIKNDEKLLKSKCTVVCAKDWHKGVLGIVASRLTETYYRPTIVLTQSNGLVTGSARSVQDFDILNAVTACSDLLEHYGGHKYAAGLSFKAENLSAFKNRFEEYVTENISEDMLIEDVEIDGRIDLSEISSKFFRILKQFAPFGPGNMSPVFLTKGVMDSGYARVVGKNHLKAHVSDADKYGLSFFAIAFQQGEHLKKVKSRVPFDICYQIEENEWNGNITTQLNIKDIKFEY